MKLGRKLLKDYAISEWQFRENITVWLIYHRSSEGYYNYKKIALVVVYPDMPDIAYEEADPRQVTEFVVHTGAYQDYDDPLQVINTLRYLARKYKLHCRVVWL